MVGLASWLHRRFCLSFRHGEGLSAQHEARSPVQRGDCGVEPWRRHMRGRGTSRPSHAMSWSSGKCANGSRIRRHVSLMLPADLHRARRET
jgi:hypothetical protein